MSIVQPLRAPQVIIDDYESGAYIDNFSTWEESLNEAAWSSMPFGVDTIVLYRKVYYKLNDVTGIYDPELKVVNPILHWETWITPLVWKKRSRKPGPEFSKLKNAKVVTELPDPAKYFSKAVMKTYKRDLARQKYALRNTPMMYQLKPGWWKCRSKDGPVELKKEP